MRVPPELRFERRMSDSDALMWFIENDAALRSTITTLTLLDRAPAHAGLLEKAEQATRVVPRLRERVAANPFSIAPPRWEVDPDFDLAFHVRFERAAGAGSLRELLDSLQPFTMEGFDRSRPLWQLRVIECLEGGRAAMAMKLHHSLSDGVGLVQMMSCLIDLDREGAPASALPQPEPFRVMTMAERILDALGFERRRQVGRAKRTLGLLADSLAGLVRDPLSAAREVGRAVTSVGRLLRPISSPLSPIMGGRSTRVRLDLLTVDFRALKNAARAAGGTLNDAFVAAVTGGLRVYHEEHGAPTEALRMTMPINLRSRDDETTAGNQFVPVRFTVPLAIADPTERMRVLGRLAREQRAEPALPIVGELAAMFNRFPAAVSAAMLGAMMKGVDFVTSNVPGPNLDLFVCGARVESLIGFGPLTGAAANATLFSYRGQCAVGVSSDPAAVPDPDLFLECLRRGFAEVLAAGGAAAPLTSARFSAS
jgi:diacylglycerol O-acyltransferase / wax synthase